MCKIVCTRSFTVLKSEAEIWNFWKQPWNLQGKWWFTTDSQGHIRMSDGDPRTGTFHWTRVTVGNTTCRVNGVLHRHMYSYQVIKFLQKNIRMDLRTDWILNKIKSTDSYKMQQYVRSTELWEMTLKSTLLLLNIDIWVVIDIKMLQYDHFRKSVLYTWLLYQTVFWKTSFRVRTLLFHVQWKKLLFLFLVKGLQWPGG